MRVLGLGLTGLGVLSVQVAEPAEVAYPWGYREWWHVKSIEVKPGHGLYESFGGIRHVYANPNSVKGYRSGRYSDGAFLVFDLLESKNEGNALLEGGRNMVGVMARGSRRFAATRGCGFEGSAGGDPQKPLVKGNAPKAFFECHAVQKSEQYCFPGCGIDAVVSRN